MALLFNILFCLVLLYSASYCLFVPPIQNEDALSPVARNPSPHLLTICAFARQRTSRKIICIICKGFDPSCNHTPTSTTPSPVTTTALSTTTSVTSTTPTTVTPISTTEIPAPEEER